MTVRITDTTMRRALLTVSIVGGLAMIALSLFPWLDFTPDGSVVIAEPPYQRPGNPGNANVVTTFGALIALTGLAAVVMKDSRPLDLLIAVMGLAAFAIALHDGLAAWRGPIESSSRGIFFPADGNASVALWLTLACSLVVSVCAGVTLGIQRHGVNADQPIVEAKA